MQNELTEALTRSKAAAEAKVSLENELKKLREELDEKQREVSLFIIRVNPLVEILGHFSASFGGGFMVQVKSKAGFLLSEQLDVTKATTIDCLRRLIDIDSRSATKV